MSVRIHQLSKEVGLENKELIALLQERGYDVSSPSNTIDNISAESLVEEFRQKTEEPAPAIAEDTKNGTEQKPATEEKPAPETPQATPPPPPPVASQPKSPAPPPQPPSRPAGPPPGAMVKTADDLQKEREAREAERRASVRPPQPQARPAPRAPQPPQPRQPGRPPVPGPRGPAGAPPPTRSAGAPPSPRPAGAPPQPNRPASPPPAPRAGGPPPPPPSAAAEAEAPTAPVDPGKPILIKPPIVVRDFATQLGLKPFRLISELMEMNIFASMNQVIEEDVAHELAKRHGFTLEIRHRGEGQSPQPKKQAPAPVDEATLLELRPPVVCILGHVDHGKTTLLDTIRKANVVAGEFGGITQHIGAYQIEFNDHKITFLDTPGHAAFEKMRARGAEVTDIVVLVVAADDGFMPQTDEALKHAQRAGAPVMVAINKTDVPGADIDRVKNQMAQRGIQAEDWGGETIAVGVSALKGEGIDDLLEMILLQNEIMELKANPKGAAEGVIIESQMETGRGPTATVIVQKGTLKTGAALVCGHNTCKVRAMMDERGQTVKSAPPSTPVKIVGWSETPEAGSIFREVKNDREARRLAEEAEIEARQQIAAATTGGPPAAGSLESLMSAIADTKRKTLHVVVKADVAGSLEAVIENLKAIKSDKVDLDVIESGVGPVSKNDVNIASTSEAAVVGFNVKVENGVQGIAKHHGVKIYQNNIIYELIDLVQEAMADLLEPERYENKLGRAEVRAIFPVARGQVAGCMVTDGNILRDRFARVLRGKDLIHEGRVSTLKRFKDDVTEVRAGYECGVRLDDFNDYQEGDQIECFEILERRATL